MPTPSGSVVRASNSAGWLLLSRKSGTYWSILLPQDGCNKVAHVGKESHVRKMWRERFANVKKNNPFPFWS